MKGLLLFVLLLVSGAWSQEKPWEISLHTLIDGGGAWHNVTEFTNDLNKVGFNDVTKSICGHGVWLYYSQLNYARSTWPFGDSWTEQFVHSEYKCHTLADSRQNQVSSVRFVGSGNFEDEILTLYNGQEFTAGEDVFIRNDDNLGVFSNTTESMIVVGESSWTIYATKYYQGEALCLDPSPMYNSIGEIGLYYGAWEMSALSIPNNAISSLKKGCHAKRRVAYKP